MHGGFKFLTFTWSDSSLEKQLFTACFTRTDERLENKIFCASSLAVMCLVEPMSWKDFLISATTERMICDLQTVRRVSEDSFCKLKRHIVRKHENLLCKHGSAANSERGIMQHNGSQIELPGFAPVQPNKRRWNNFPLSPASSVLCVKRNEGKLDDAFLKTVYWDYETLTKGERHVMHHFAALH